MEQIVSECHMHRNTVSSIRRNFCKGSCNACGNEICINSAFETYFKYIMIVWIR